MKNRLIALRKNLKLTQAEFAKRINLTRAAISQYELGNNQITERTVSDICREFNVSEDWLRNGTGPMFRPIVGINNELATAVGSLISSEDDFTKKVVLKYLQLPEEHRKIFEKFLRSLVAEENNTEKK